MAVQKAKPKRVKKAARLVETLNLTVVGVSHRFTTSGVEALEEMVRKSGGLKCKIKPEPDNEVDKNALMVVISDKDRSRWNGLHVGYIKKAVNKRVAKLLDSDATLRCRLVYVQADNPAQAEGELEVKVYL